MAAASHRVEIDNPAEARISINLHGELFRNVKDDLLHDCVNAFLQCANENACFERGLNVNCLGTLAAHNARTGCCENAFGIAAR